MQGADISATLMKGVHLAGAQMDNRTILHAANLAGAALQKADYTYASFSEAQVTSCFGDASVVLPGSIPRPAHWPDWQLLDTGKQAFRPEWRKWKADPDAYRPPSKPK